MSQSRRVNFDELKARADFRRVLLQYGLEPVGTGEQVKIPCPFHTDERPSCSVNLGKKLFHCFGCDLKGNVLDFVHRMETKDGATVSLRQAGLKLAEICSIGGADGKAPETRQERRSASTIKETTLSSSGGQNGASGRSSRARPEFAVSGHV